MEQEIGKKTSTTQEDTPANLPQYLSAHKGQREKTGTNYISQINKPLEKAVLLCRQQQAYSPEHLCQSSSRVRRKAGGTHQENEIGNHSRESKLKASGPQSTHSGGLIFSVCGLFCGQSPDRKF